MIPRSLPFRRVATFATAMFGALLLITGRPSTSAGPRRVMTDSVLRADTLRVYYVGYAIGYERYQLTSDSAGYTLEDDFDQVDRGRRNHTVAAMRLGRDFSPRQLEIERLTDTSRRAETRVDVAERDATVVAQGETTRVTLPPVAFAIAGTTPAAQHLALIRYWRAHGRPTTLAAIPGGPINEVRIEPRGRDTVRIGARRTVLDRYAVDGVVWGGETVWLDQAGWLAAYATAGGGGLSLESVRLDLEPALPQLVARVTQDRLADLARISRSVAPQATSTIALVGATLIDGTGRDPTPDAIVVVSEGKVAAAGPRGSVAMPPGARRWDVPGKTIIPGLWDMHTHVMQIEWAPVYLAAGVTTVRDMGNEIDFVVPLRDAIRAGQVIGPRMLLAGLIDGGGPNAFGAVNATTPEEGRAAVRRYRELGFEQVKLYDLLQPDVVAAITAEAHRLGMTVTGHVPRSLTLLAAVDSGMDQVAHLPIRGEARSDSVRRVIESLRAHGTVIDPTASCGELLGHAAAEPVASFQPGVSRLPPVLYQRIIRMGDANADTTAAHARLRRTLGVIGALHTAGVPVVAGTDEGVPGFSVYREIELYVAAGFSPMEALRAATAVPAKAMRLDQEVGTMEPGKRADLLVLDRDPLDNISNVRSVNLVMTRGTLYRSADLWRAAGFR